MPIRVGERWLAVDACSVVEVVVGARVHRLGTLPSSVAGVIAWRGRAIPVFDLRSDPSAAISRFLVTQIDTVVCALAADNIAEVQLPSPSHAHLDLGALVRGCS